eukprot:3619931-Rhodomonas_salina.2
MLGLLSGALPHWHSICSYCEPTLASDKVLTYAVLLPGSEALLEDDPTADGGSHCAVRTEQSPACDACDAMMTGWVRGTDLGEHGANAGAVSELEAPPGHWRHRRRSV